MEIFHGRAVPFCRAAYDAFGIFAGAGRVRGLLMEKHWEILPFYLMSFLGLYLYFSVSGLSWMYTWEKAALKTSLTDYLENPYGGQAFIYWMESEWLARTRVQAVSGRRCHTPEMEREGEEQDKIQAEAEQTTVKQSAGKLIAAGAKGKNHGRKEWETMERGPAETQMEEQIFTKNQEKELEELLKGVFCIIQHC